MATEQQKALAKIQKEAIRAISQRLQGATGRQSEIIKRAAAALTREQFGDVAYMAFVKTGRAGR